MSGSTGEDAALRASASTQHNAAAQPEMFSGGAHFA